MKAKILKVEKQLKQLLEATPSIQKSYHLARSVKGIGLICAAHLIVHTNNFQAFDTWRKFACYIGIAPFPKRSGSALNRPAKVSHLGHKKLKALLTNGVMNAIQTDKELKTYYQRKLAEGKTKYSVFNAIKNKLVSRVFATVKRGTPFVEFGNYA